MRERALSLGRRVGSWLAFALLATVVVALVAAAVAPLVGYRIVIVAGGSMEPTLAVGSVAVLEEVDGADVRAGDVVLFRAPGTSKVTTHRVVSIAEGGEGFVTKGDANNAPDADTVPSAAVEARYRFSVPFVGRFAEWTRSPLGYVLVILVPGLAIIAMELRSVARGLRKRPADRIRRGHRRRRWASRGPGALRACRRICVSAYRFRRRFDGS